MSTKKDILDILRTYESEGYLVRKGGSGHNKVFAPDGRMVTVLASTPKQAGSVRHAKAQQLKILSAR